MSEKFCLKWNDFHSNASKSFGALRSEEYLHDVTLISDDQHQVTAHKLVLAASSDYFKSVFKNKISNPFLCLDGVSSADLDNILDYIYNGEVQIYQEHLDRFLSVAQRFKLEGLLGGEQEATEEKEVKDEKIFIPQSRTRNRNPENRKPENIKPDYPETAPEDNSIQINSQILPLDTNDLHEIDEKLHENLEKNSDGMWCCKICNKAVSNKKYNAKLHVEIHMEGLSFPCNTCGKEFRSRNTLGAHFSKNRCK